MCQESAEPAGSVPEPSLNLPARSVQTQLTGNRLRNDGVLYELRSERVTDADEISRFGVAWTSHGVFHRDPSELEEVWVYRLEAR